MVASNGINGSNTNSISSYNSVPSAPSKTSSKFFTDKRLSNFEPIVISALDNCSIELVSRNALINELNDLFSTGFIKSNLKTYYDINQGISENTIIVLSFFIRDLIHSLKKNVGNVEYDLVLKKFGINPYIVNQFSSGQEFLVGGKTGNIRPVVKAAQALLNRFLIKYYSGFQRRAASSADIYQIPSIDGAIGTDTFLGFIGVSRLLEYNSPLQEFQGNLMLTSLVYSCAGDSKLGQVDHPMINSLFKYLNTIIPNEKEGTIKKKRITVPLHLEMACAARLISKLTILKKEGKSNELDSELIFYSKMIDVMGDKNQKSKLVDEYKSKILAKTRNPFKISKMSELETLILDQHKTLTSKTKELYFNQEVFLQRKFVDFSKKKKDQDLQLSGNIDNLLSIFVSEKYKREAFDLIADYRGYVSFNGLKNKFGSKADLIWKVLLEFNTNTKEIYVKNGKEKVLYFLNEGSLSLKEVETRVLAELGQVLGPKELKSLTDMINQAISLNPLLVDSRAKDGNLKEALFVHILNDVRTHFEQVKAQEKLIAEEAAEISARNKPKTAVQLKIENLVKDVNSLPVNNGWITAELHSVAGTLSFIVKEVEKNSRDNWIRLVKDQSEINEILKYIADQQRSLKTYKYDNAIKGEDLKKLEQVIDSLGDAQIALRTLGTSKLDALAQISLNISGNILDKAKGSHKESFIGFMKRFLVKKEFHAKLDEGLNALTNGMLNTNVKYSSLLAFLDKLKAHPDYLELLKPSLALMSNKLDLSSVSGEELAVCYPFIYSMQTIIPNKRINYANNALRAFRKKQSGTNILVAMQHKIPNDWQNFVNVDFKQLVDSLQKNKSKVFDNRKNVNEDVVVALLDANYEAVLLESIAFLKEEFSLAPKEWDAFQKILKPRTDFRAKWGDPIINQLIDNNIIEKSGAGYRVSDKYNGQSWNAVHGINGIKFVQQGISTKLDDQVLLAESLKALKKGDNALAIELLGRMFKHQLSNIKLEYVSEKQIENFRKIQEVLQGKYAEFIYPQKWDEFLLSNLSNLSGDSVAGVISFFYLTKQASFFDKAARQEFVSYIKNMNLHVFLKINYPNINLTLFETKINGIVSDLSSPALSEKITANGLMALLKGLLDLSQGTKTKYRVSMNLNAIALSLNKFKS